MEFWSTIGALLRRKRVLLPALLVGLALGVVADKGTPVSYISSTTMVLTTTEYGSSESQDPTLPTNLTNPMLNFNGSLTTTSAILIESMNTKGIRTQLGVAGPTRLVVDDGRSNPNLLGLNGPFLFIEGMSTSPTEAQRVVVEAQKLMRQKLHDWQIALNAPKTTFVSLQDVVPPTAPEPDRGRATKLAIIAFLLGFLLCLGIAYFGHQFRARRRARAARRGPSASDATMGEDGDDSRADRSPSVIEVAAEAVEEDDEDDDEEAEDDDGAATAVVRTAFESKPASAGMPTPLRRNGKANGASGPLENVDLAVVRVPVKLKVRSRNR
jgi:hypothetical protein